MILLTNLSDDSYFFCKSPLHLAFFYLILSFYLTSFSLFVTQVQVGEDSYIHLRIFRIVPSKHGEVELEEVLDEKKDSDPLEAFEMEGGAVAAN